MNKNLENKLHGLGDQDLTAVSGGSGEAGYESPYSVGQRVRVLPNQRIYPLLPLISIDSQDQMCRGGN